MILLTIIKNRPRRAGSRTAWRRATAAPYILVYIYIYIYIIHNTNTNASTSTHKHIIMIILYCSDTTNHNIFNANDEAP